MLTHCNITKLKRFLTAIVLAFCVETKKHGKAVRLRQIGIPKLQNSFMAYSTLKCLDMFDRAGFSWWGPGAQLTWGH